MIEFDKDAVATKLLWVDLEMTGLDVAKDLIVEVAVEVTDFDFKTLASYEAIITLPVCRRRRGELPFSQTLHCI